ncbi:ornithine--oxo-acid transaminase [bacterium]|nr:ornithine--oxo-acid transaminase [bacterium]
MSISDKTKKIIDEADRYGAHNYHPLPVVLCRGEGVWVWDVDGKKYLDCLSAYSAVNQGHCHPRIVKALVEQSSKFSLSSRAFHNDQMGSFLKAICEFSGFEKALPMNSGAEAVETAIKALRKWGYLKKGVAAEQAEIIVCSNNFHGRTVSIVSFSSEEGYREGFGPFTPGFKIISYNDLQAFEEAITKNTVAFLLEPIQGEAGILIPDKGYLKGVQQICKKNNVMLAVDEIQTGLGRTGRDFCFQHELSENPDVLILGKAISGGLYPVSVMLASEEILGVFKPGQHGSTFGGNPLGSRVAAEALAVIKDEKLSQRAAQLGEGFIAKLKTISSSHVEEVRGLGLMIAIEIKKSSGPARPFCEKLQALGVLAKETHGQSIRLAPPLVIKQEELDWLFEQIKSVL